MSRRFLYLGKQSISAATTTNWVWLILKLNLSRVPRKQAAKCVDKLLDDLNLSKF